MYAKPSLYIQRTFTVTVTVTDTLHPRTRTIFKFVHE